MLIKYSLSSGINLGQYVFPLHIGEQEIFLSFIQMPNLTAGDHVVIEAGVSWQKNWDIGQLQIIIRKDSPHGTIVYQAEETCFSSTYSTLRYVDREIVNPSHAYYLSVKSTDSPVNQAKLTGNVSFVVSAMMP
ncbi:MULTISPECIES: hypothetical protein [unclassified Paenibacillus]|uniref:hypothetical protein n=1 Tax=unclassified Paenibacillus TaxID=185978 RepID=UPI001C120730|nr:MULTISPECIES: hypothetical protein [unclassified Paenibacillus]MBU5440821.1 hypothetical protein [Paenibacillus sp. MSJ-34]CAH0118483.1 hypothetical protein PAE9249_00972 [Paenibacillus sp. CECT 9249]